MGLGFLFKFGMEKKRWIGSVGKGDEKWKEGGSCIYLHLEEDMDNIDATTHLSVSW